METTLSKAIQNQAKMTFPTHTPPLKEKPMVCNICGGIGVYRIDVPESDSRFGKTFPCQCRSKEIAERYQDLIGYQLRPANLSELHTKGRPGTAHMIEMAKTFSANPEGWLTIWGTNGTGKSVVLRSIASTCINSGITALYIPLQIAVDWFKAGIEYPDFPVDKRIERIASVPVLCIDEVTGAFWSEWVRTKVETMLDIRYSYNLPTVLAMDENPETSLHPRLVSRMRESVFVHNADPDYRRALGAAKERMTNE